MVPTDVAGIIQEAISNRELCEQMETTIGVFNNSTIYSGMHVCVLFSTMVVQLMGRS